jgi:hypothetical protein
MKRCTLSPGQATSHFKGAFDEIVCVDPSAGMLSKARDFLFKAQPSQLAYSPSETPKETQFTFAQGYGEDLRTAIPEDGSIDVLISGARPFPTYSNVPLCLISQLLL